ncbi:MAG: GNAT family N-acetyltransferase [Verrucomicrobiota bacterium]
MKTEFSIREATVADVPLILGFIRGLAAYEKLSHEVTATEELLRRNLFGERRRAEALLAFEGTEGVGFALFFHNFSTFVGKPGIYLEDLFIRPEFRGRGYGKALMVYLARLAKQRDCGRFEWWVLDWNTPSLEFYRSLGAVSMSDWTVQRLTGDALTALAAQPLPNN